MLVFFVVLGAFSAAAAARVRRRRRERVQAVMLAAAEAAQDDPAFAADRVGPEAGALFVDIQKAWDGRDRARLRELIGGDLLVEWERRLDDFDARGWRSRVQVVREPTVEYVGLVNRAADEEDRAVVRISAALDVWVQTPAGQRIYNTGHDGPRIAFAEYWTLAKHDGGWMLVSIEQDAEGIHHLTDEIVASPWSDSRLHDEALVEQAVADRVPEGFTPADAASFDVRRHARARRRWTCRWPTRASYPTCSRPPCGARRRRGPRRSTARTRALQRVASPEAIDALLYGGDAQRRTRLVVRGPRIAARRHRARRRAGPAGAHDGGDRRPRPALPRGPRHRRGGGGVARARGDLLRALGARPRRSRRRALARRRRRDTGSGVATFAA